MDEQRILGSIKTYVKTHMKDISLDGFEQRRVQEVFKASIDIVDFIMDMEEGLKLEEEINLEKLGPRFAQETTFAELAVEIKKYLEKQGQKTSNLNNS